MEDLVIHTSLCLRLIKCLIMHQGKGGDSYKHLQAIQVIVAITTLSKGRSLWLQAVEGIHKRINRNRILWVWLKSQNLRPLKPYWKLNLLRNTLNLLLISLYIYMEVVQGMLGHLIHSCSLSKMAKLLCQEQVWTVLPQGNLSLVSTQALSHMVIHVSKDLETVQRAIGELTKYLQPLNWIQIQSLYENRVHEEVVVRRKTTLLLRIYEIIIKALLKLHPEKR